MGEDAFSLSYPHHSSAQVSKCIVDSRARVRQLQAQFRDNIKRTSTLIYFLNLPAVLTGAAQLPSLRQVLQQLHLNLHLHALLQLPTSQHIHVHMHLRHAAAGLIFLDKCLYVVAWILLC